MTDHASNGGGGVSSSFKIIGIVALIWNLLGLAAFAMSFMVTEDALALMSEAQVEDYHNTPMWSTIVFGIATITGTLGCITLLMKKKLSVILFLISFVAVIIQNGYWVTNSAAVKEGGATSYIMPILVIVIAGLLWNYSKKCDARGWLS